MAQLRCGDCGSLVERGWNFCPTCKPEMPGRSLALKPDVQRGPSNGSHLAVQPTGLLPLPPSFGGAPLPMPMVVPPSYVQNRFGVSAEVQLSGQDAEILTLMSQAATLLHGLAAKMNTFSGVMKSTRDVIRGCRDLATLLQEEIEVRRGPQG